MNVPTLTVRELDCAASLTQPYDAFFTTIGFETRARFIAEEYSPKATLRLAPAFTERRVLAFKANAEWFSKAGFESPNLSENEFQDWAKEIVRQIPFVRGKVIRLCVDISSMSRVRIAAFLSAIYATPADCSIEIDWVYALASFSEPPREIVPIVCAEPVIPEFAGMPDDPELPTSVILGLGYEYDKAIGTIELMEPAAVFAFRPTRHDERYTQAISLANRSFCESLGEDSIIDYAVDAPFDAFVAAESLVFGCRRDSRPVLVPFGPKIFCLVSLLVASIHSPHVAVWRVSSGQLEPPVDRTPNGKVVGLRTVIEPLRQVGD